MRKVISIIIATFNSEKTLECTIRSVIEQSYFDNIELIIIDGGSLDKTVDIIKKFDKYISYWISEPDEGIYHALNKGIDVATGDYVEIIGSDDFFVNDCIIEYVAKELNNSVDILSTCCYIVNEKYKLQKFYDNMHAVNKKRFPGWMVPHGGMFVRNQILKRYRFDTNYKIASDYDFFLKCYTNDKIIFKFRNIPVYYFSLSGISAQKDIQDEVKKIQEKYDLECFNGRSRLSGRKYNFIERIKTFIKFTLDYIALGRYWRIYFAGWQKHRCANPFCRWCNKSSKI